MTAPRAKPADPTGAAFFDFDNTLVHGDAGPLFGNYLVRERYERIRTEQGKKAADRDRAKLAAKYVPFAMWMGLQTALYKTRAVRRSQLVRSAYKALRGIEATHYYALIDDFVAHELSSRIYPEMVKEIEKHQAAGRVSVVVTTGAEALVKRALALFPPGVDVIGCRLEERDGRLTGRVDGPLYGADKANIVSAYCQAAGVKVRDCWAYTDHYSDYHMLEAVGHGVVVNPRGRLREMAGERKWRVMRPKDPRQA